MKIKISLLVVACQALAASALLALEPCQVSVDAKTVLREVNPLFFGVNTLFWIEDDASLKDGRLAQQLKEMPCRLMRFPGGEVADNYHWQTRKLDNLKQFPYSDGPGKLDTDKFMVLCRQVGAEPIFVVNLETCLLRHNLDEGIQEAIAWVRYANKEKNYNVRYWEIGNETYLPSSRLALKAAQYADAAAKISRAMKAVDPTIKIGFVGPEFSDYAPPMERLTDEELAECQKISGHERRDVIKQKANAKGGGQFPAWWPTVVKQAANDFDFAVIHCYQPSKFGGEVKVGKPVVQLKEFFSKQLPGRTIPVALTEWNSGRDIPNAMASALVVAELVGEYLKAGVDMACEWPMRYPGGESTRSLFDTKTNDPKPAYTVIKLYSSNMGKGTKLVETLASQKSVYVCASLSGDSSRLTVFLVNKSADRAGAAVAVSLAGFKSKTAQAATLAGGDLKKSNTKLQMTPVELKADNASLVLPPNSLTVLTCEN